MSDRLRTLWDFDDLDASEARFRGQLEREESSATRSEVLTQLARVAGLRGAFDAGEQLVEDAEALAGESAIARARIDLERGRLRRSSGDSVAAFPLFERAFETALGADELFIAVDAAHMAAIATTDAEAIVAWTERGIELAEGAEPSVRYWLGPLLNNLGWHHYERGEFEDALGVFERALAERERDPGNRQGVEIALYCVAKTLRAHSRASEGVPLLERALASAATDGRTDLWLHEELAESYTALGRKADAREHAEAALALLPEADPTEREGAQATRLRHIAAEVGEAP